MGRDEPAVASIAVPAGRLTPQAMRDGLAESRDARLTSARSAEADLEHQSAVPGLGWEL